VDVRTRKKLTVKYVFIFPQQTILPDLFKKGVEDMQDVEYGVEWPESWNVKVENMGRGYTGPTNYKLRLVDKNEDPGPDEEDPYGTATKYTFLIWCNESKLKDVIDFLKYLGMGHSNNFYKSI
jgi:hypothetical protein